MSNRKRRSSMGSPLRQAASTDHVDALEAARTYGVDISLLIESLRLTPAQRLARLDEQVESLRQLRAAAIRSGLG